MLAADQTISGVSLWAAIVILCREILVSGLREYLAELSVPVPVTAVAKWKTDGATRRARLPDRRSGGRSGASRLDAVGFVLLWVAAILTLYTGWDYMKASYDHVGGDEAP